MNVRLKHMEVYPEAYQHMRQLEQMITESGLDRTLYELIKLRASQINGCAFCIDMHTKEMRKMGIPDQRIDLLPAWKEAPCYTDAERAVLALTEAVTRISEHGVSDEIYEGVRAHFSERDIVVILMSINIINCWNRLAISTGMYPGM